LQYRGRTLVQTFHPDFVCYEEIILEIKAVSQLCDEHRAQVLNYLSATSCKLGLLVNFGHYPRLEYERPLPRSQETVDLRLWKFRVLSCVSWAASYPRTATPAAAGKLCRGYNGVRSALICGSENFVSFRVFRGPQNIPARRLAPVV
jgi:hypothetical protein